MDIGGMCGDSKDSIDIYNEESVRALMVYQALSDYFAIDASNVVSTAKGSSSKGIMNVVYGE